jgi:hypothetical protein
MEQNHEPLAALDMAIELVGNVRSFYEEYSMRGLEDDRPHDPRPYWTIPPKEIALTSPNRWQGMPVRLLEKKLSASPLLAQLHRTLTQIADQFGYPKLLGVPDARNILEAVHTNLQQVRIAVAQVVLDGQLLPKRPPKGVFPKAVELEPSTIPAAAAVAEHLNISDAYTLNHCLTCGFKGRVLKLHNCSLPHQAVGYYLYRESKGEVPIRQKILTIVEVGGFSEGGVPEVLAADMVKNLCEDPEMNRPLSRFLNPVVKYEKNEE